MFPSLVWSPSAWLGAIFALFYFSYGIYLPYWSLWLDGVGVSADQIGLLLGVSMVARTLGNLWVMSRVRCAAHLLPALRILAWLSVLSRPPSITLASASCSPWLVRSGVHRQGGLGPHQWPGSSGVVWVCVHAGQSGIEMSSVCVCVKRTHRYNGVNELLIQLDLVEVR